jgi:hypothetical protein
MSDKTSFIPDRLSETREVTHNGRTLRTFENQPPEWVNPDGTTTPAMSYSEWLELRQDSSRL